MKSARKYAIALVTAPTLKVARALAHSILKQRLAACANLIPKIESHYWWKGKIESSPEVLLILKTERKCLRALEKHILAEHPYDTPEILVVSLDAGTDKYLRWISDSVRATAIPKADETLRGSVLKYDRPLEPVTELGAAEETRSQIQTKY